MESGKENWHGEVGEYRRLMPRLDEVGRNKLRNALKASLGVGDGHGARVSAELRERAQGWGNEDVVLQAVCHLLADLWDQGWIVHCDKDIVLIPPGRRVHPGEPIGRVKERIQEGLLAGRNRQLAEPSVQEFLSRVQRPVSGKYGSGSIFDVIDNGAALASALERIRKLEYSDRDAALARIIRPEVEICDSQARCSASGLKLLDIWRFFRHTWSLQYRSVPGRKVPVLIRNAARPNRPVMGIAMLSSPVMKLQLRDDWIGWTLDSAIGNVFTGEWDAKQFVDALEVRIARSLAEIRSDDFLIQEELWNPDINTVIRLERLAEKASLSRFEGLRENYEAHGPTANPYDNPADFGFDERLWHEASSDPLFVRKRAETLARLLDARRVLSDLKLSDNPMQKLRHAFTTKASCSAIETVLSEFRKEGLASRVMDLTVCGAVAPYNTLLGGKLVALLMGSREVEGACKERYGNSPSLIASQMAGRPIVRDPTLKILTTTSLYGVGSSQYNRLVLQASRYRGIPHGIKWLKLGKNETSAGFGTVHLGKESTNLLREIGSSADGARRYNSRFGEGASPRLMQTRQGLQAIGIPAGHVLHHATPRLVYGCELISDASQQLLGMKGPKKEIKPTVAAISRAWRRRWLSKRIERDDVIEKIFGLGANSILASLNITPSASDSEEIIG